MVNIGLIGCGWIIEKAHIPAFQKRSDAKITSVYDANRDRAKEIAEKYGFTVSLAVEDLLCSDIDAVIIATPNDTHTFYTDLALAYKKHVLCEKPVALSGNAYKNSLKTAEVNHTILLPAFVNRFREEIIQLSQMIQQGLIGEVDRIEAYWVRKAGIPRPGTWITNKEHAGGGALIDIGSHLLDICLMLFKEEQIEKTGVGLEYRENHELESAGWCNNAESKYMAVDIETAASGRIRFKTGKYINFRVSWSDDIAGDETRITVYGNNGFIQLNTLFGFSNAGIHKEITLSISGKEEKNYKFSFHNSASLAFERMAGYFLDVIQGKPLTYLTPEDGLYVIKAIELLYKSEELAEA